MLLVPTIVSTPSDVILFNALCTAAESVGDPVFISGPKVGGIISVLKVDTTDINKMPVIGLIESKPTATTCVVQSVGDLLGLPFTFTVGKRVFATSTGLSSIIPGAGNFAQVVGIATDTNDLSILIFDPVRFV